MNGRCCAVMPALNPSWPLLLLRLLLSLPLIPLVIRDHAEPALEISATHSVARRQDAAQMVTIHRHIVAVEDKIALQSDEDGLVLQIRVWLLDVSFTAARVDRKHRDAV